MATINSIEVHCDGQNLSLDCGPEDFVRLRSLIAAELGDGFSDLNLDDVENIDIRTIRATASNDHASLGSTISAAAVIGGCLVLLLAMGVGIWQIVAWFNHWKSN
jgi:hypothetical protein